MQEWRSKGRKKGRLCESLKRKCSSKKVHQDLWESLIQSRLSEDSHIFCASELSHFSHVQLFVTLWTAARQAPLSTGLLQVRILEWVAMPSSRGSSQPRDGTCVSCIAGVFFTAEPPGKPSHIFRVQDFLNSLWCSSLAGTNLGKSASVPISAQMMDFGAQSSVSYTPCS